MSVHVNLTLSRTYAYTHNCMYAWKMHKRDRAAWKYGYTAAVTNYHNFTTAPRKTPRECDALSPEAIPMLIKMAHARPCLRIHDCRSRADVYARRCLQ